MVGWEFSITVWEANNRLNSFCWGTLSTHVDETTRVWTVILASVHWEQQPLSIPSFRQSRDLSASWNSEVATYAGLQLKNWILSETVKRNRCCLRTSSTHIDVTTRTCLDRRSGVNSQGSTAAVKSQLTTVTWPLGEHRWNSEVITYGDS